MGGYTSEQDDLITLRRSDLAEALVAEMVDFYLSPYGLEGMRRSEARCIAADGIDLALREEALPKRSS